MWFEVVLDSSVTILATCRRDRNGYVLGSVPMCPAIKTIFSSSHRYISWFPGQGEGVDSKILQYREQLRSDLLLTAHHSRKVYDVTFHRRIKGPLDYGAISDTQKLCALRYDI